MTGNGCLLALDAGTTGIRAMAFDLSGTEIHREQEEFGQHFPRPGWVEHDLDEIWDVATRVLGRIATELSERGHVPLALGISNQRETVAIWDSRTGKPIGRAIVWQDRRTADQCRALKANGHEDLVRSRTGLLLDPYFSATKLAWRLNADAELRDRAADGKALFGTIESYLIFRLTGGRHVSDSTNASRTLLFDIHEGRWSPDLLDLMDVPAAMLPEVVPNAAAYGRTKKSEIGLDVPITGAAGDQQAAAIGQACLGPGETKSTYGTGCFVLQNTGDQAVHSTSRLLTTIAYQLDGKVNYALEGSIFIAGAALQWLRDGLKILEHVSDSARHAEDSAEHSDVYLVPAFAGLGAPHWDPDARGAIFGLTRDTSRSDIIRATLESVAYQTADLLEAFRSDGAGGTRTLRVDGGMAANDWFCQFLADILDAPVERPVVTETTALGAAILAAVGCGEYSSLSEATGLWRSDRLFEPGMDEELRQKKLAGWRKAVRSTLT